MRLFNFLFIYLVPPNSLKLLRSTIRVNLIPQASIRLRDLVLLQNSHHTKQHMENLYFLLAVIPITTASAQKISNKGTDRGGYGYHQVMGPTTGNNSQNMVIL